MSMCQKEHPKTEAGHILTGSLRCEKRRDKRQTKQTLKPENAKIGWCDKCMRNLHNERCPF